jgi:hypothetical protein
MDRTMAHLNIEHYWCRPISPVHSTETCYLIHECNEWFSQLLAGIGTA